jgi:predicted nucleotidyltransferase
MIDLVASKQAEIEALCEEYGVQRLWLFGSAAKGAWNSVSSDLDFIVDLGEYEQGVSSRFLGLVVALESLFRVRVDLLTHRQVKSDWFRKEVESSRVLVYDSTRQSVVA